jgi:hypothetical protein
MDDFAKLSFPAALPGAFTFNETVQPLQQSSRHPFIFHDVSSGESRIRETSRRQWETLKSLIQRVYIEENKPFPYLAKILREEHGFEPT